MPYRQQWEVHQLNDLKRIQQCEIWGRQRCDFATLSSKEFESFNSQKKFNARVILAKALNLIRFNKVEYLRTLSLLDWEKNLKSQLLWDDFMITQYVAPVSLFHHAIMNNATQSMDYFREAAKIGINIEHLECAINNHAESALAYLLKHIELSPATRQSLIQQACLAGNVTMVKMLSGDDDGLLYFTNMIDVHKKDINFVVSLAYRYSNMQDVDKALKKYIKMVKTRRDSQDILNNIIQARNDFLKWGTQIAKYRKQTDLAELSDVYLKKVSAISLEKDITFGLDNFKIIEKIVTNPKIEIALPENFQTLLPLPAGFKDHGTFPSMRALLRFFSEAHYEEAMKRGNPDAEKFKTVRGSTSRTPSTSFKSNRYDHARPYIEAMFTLPVADNEHFSRRKIEDLHGWERYPAYALMYKGIEMCGVLLDSQMWCHAKAPIKEIWPYIEQLHADIFSMSRADIMASPLAFYDKVIELIWLIGNLTPMERGTGRIVEQELALIHKYFNLAMPILKPGLQLDCLDLTFSLPVYKKLFLSFCEPNSLEKCVADAHYNRCKTDRETMMLHKHFSVTFEPSQVPSDAVFLWLQLNFSVGLVTATVHKEYLQNETFRKAVTAAYEYMNSGQFGFFKAHGRDGKARTQEFVGKLLLEINKQGSLSTPSIQNHMQNWLKPNANGRGSNANRYSRSAYAYASGILSKKADKNIFLEKNSSSRARRAAVTEMLGINIKVM